jgi:antitoxin PrlF
MDLGVVEMGSVSSRGQIAIPSEIRKELGLEEGSKVIFTVKDDAIILRKITAASWEELTRPFTSAKKKIREGDVPDLIHKLRREKKI